MNTHIFIGCDIGTSGAKAAATDISGRILAEASTTYGISQPHGNWAEQDPDVWLDAAIFTLRSVIEDLSPDDSDSIEAICISALYGGTGAMCDGDMSPIRPAIIWMDRRAGEESREIADIVGQASIFQVSGNGIDSYFGYTKLRWVKEHEPDNWNRIRHIVPIHSYIIYKMTGQLTVDYCSAGNVGGIYDCSTHSWSRKMCSALGIPYGSLPHDFHNPSDIIGTVNAKYQELLGLHRPVAFCAGTVDCISAMLSASMVQPGDNAAVLGTSLNWGYIHEKAPNNPNLISMPYCIEPKRYSYTYGGASTAGALPRWFANHFMEDDSPKAYDELEKMIRTQNIGPGSDGLIALPYFMGERTPIWDENAAGVLFGLTLSHTKAHIYHAILEAVGYSLRHIMESMADPDMPMDKIILVGGGAKSAIWRQILADITGLPIQTTTQEVEAPLGDAFLAAVGTGHIAEYSTIKSWVRMNPTVEPNLAKHKIYEKYFALYKKLYPALKGAMADRSDILR